MIFYFFWGGGVQSVMKNSSHWSHTYNKEKQWIINFSYIYICAQCENINIFGYYEDKNIFFFSYLEGPCTSNPGLPNVYDLITDQTYAYQEKHITTSFSESQCEQNCYSGEGAEWVALQLSDWAQLASQISSHLHVYQSTYKIWKQSVPDF